ncbi:MAG: HlyD family secretion protein [Myxococcota bacterium]
MELSLPGQARVSALRRVRPAGNVHRTVRNLSLAALLFISILLLSPWQQTAQGSGQIVAFDPASRTQMVEAPIKGRVLEWHVAEGQAVKEGDLIATLQDNDPSYLGRLNDELTTIDDRLTAAQDAVAAYDAKLAAAQASQDAAVEAAMAKVTASARKVDASDQKLAISKADAETAELNLQRVEPLFKEGLVSERKLELTQLKSKESDAKYLEARAGVAEAKAVLAESRSNLVKEREEQRGKIAAVRTERQGAGQKVDELRGKRLEVETKISRQGAQAVRAPRSGTILAILAGQGGEQVKEGETLARLVPSDVRNVVELRIAGNDVPLIQRGQKVRLQFEGWPAVQFAGWPSVAVGTFPGEVIFIDAADDGSGYFRIVVQEPDETDEPWPSQRFLRQGIRAKGWVLLSRVTMVWEVWRQLNGFPPTMPAPKGDAPQDGPKMPKALVPKGK